MEIGNQREGETDGQGVNAEPGMRYVRKRTLNQACEDWFAHPAQGQAGDRDAKLDPVTTSSRF